MVPRYEISNVCNYYLLLFSSLVPPQAFTDQHTENMIEIARFNYPGGIHNTTYAAQLVNCTVTNPGEVFSFNKAREYCLETLVGLSLGWIGRGYARIKDDGAGVCQDSESGLPFDLFFINSFTL